MSLLYISEYAELVKTPNHGPAQTPQEPVEADQVVDFSGGVEISDPFAPGTCLVYLTADADCHIVFGDDTAEATTSNKLLPAGVVLFLGVKPGMYVSAIAAS
jgi:hypothetical protein